MKYLDCVVKESLRIYPSVPLIGRKVVEDVEFSELSEFNNKLILNTYTTYILVGKTIPAGTNIGIAIYVLHRDERFFPDPLKFKPERFLDEDKKHPYCFVPFSAGSRNCIGKLRICFLSTF